MSERRNQMKDYGEIFTTSFGSPIDDDQNSITAGDAGPIIISDVHLQEKLAHFNRKRIPERIGMPRVRAPLAILRYERRRK